MLQRSLLRSLGRSFVHKCKRSVSILGSLQTSPVLVSATKDVYTNLAIEHWLYKNLKFSYQEDHTKSSQTTLLTSPVILLWTDMPCVVMGRHQNPWIETNLGYLREAKIPLARRHSGGGCVYHDEENINISMIGDRKLFEKRRDNLEFVASVIKNKYKVNLEPTKRLDLIHSESGLKLSGSAAKLGRFNCYHHMTLLVNSSIETLYCSLRQQQQNFISCNSSFSTRSKVTNLKQHVPSITTDEIINDLAEEYKKLYKGARKITTSSGPQEDKIEEENLQELGEFKQELESWDWIYGKTPKFRIEKTFNTLETGLEKPVKVHVSVNKGLFESVRIDDNPDKFQSLLGTKFTYIDAMVNVTKLIEHSPLLDQLHGTFLLKIIQDSNY